MESVPRRKGTVFGMEDRAMRLGVSVFIYGAVGGHKNGAYLKAPVHFEICRTCSPGSYSVACRHSFFFAETVTNTEWGFGGVNSRQFGGLVTQTELFLKGSNGF